MHTIRLPDLVVGTTYTKEEVQEFVARQWGTESTKDDYELVCMKLKSYLIGKTKRKPWPPTTAVVMEYRLFPIARFASHWNKIKAALRSSSDNERVSKIEEKLKAGDVAYPIWIDARLANDDPLPITEGNHRFRAFVSLGLNDVPVFLCNYA